MKHILTGLPGRALAATCIASTLFAVGTRPLAAADQWIEVKSAHFVVTSNAGDGSTRTIAWQLEQIRSAIATLWPWAKVDLKGGAVE